LKVEDSITDSVAGEKLSIIIPVFNEAATLKPFLLGLQELLRLQIEQQIVQQRVQCEIIVVDGGSNDNTRQIAESHCDKLLVSNTSRAIQMNAGAQHATGTILLFLHADTILPTDFFNLILNGINKERKFWGRFNVRLSGGEVMFRLVENMINIRSQLTGVATGDQAIFVRRKQFNEIGGFPEIDLMEDVALSKKLKKIESPLCISSRVVTSSRRWEQYGVWKTIFLMWRLRLAYFLGKNPNELKKKYL